MTRDEAIERLNIHKSTNVFVDSIAEAIDMAIEALNNITDGEDLIIKGAKGIQDGLYNIKDGKLFKYKAKGGTVRTYPIVPSADAEQGWIPCSERLPKINQRVLLATNEERVFVGYKEKPDIVWRVTEADGREHWVYDPENYTDDIDVLPKDEDCGFAKDDVYADGFLSVTSINYDDRFEGVIAWMPLPEPYREDGEV